jgi:hypothetical protein
MCAKQNLREHDVKEWHVPPHALIDLLANDCNQPGIINEAHVPKQQQQQQ